MSCPVCGNIVKEVPRVGEPHCVGCGSRPHDDRDWFEVRDVIVEIDMVGEAMRDDRTPHFDTEKSARVHVTNEDTYIGNSGVHFAEHTYHVRRLDELGICGMFIHGDISGPMQAKFDKVRVIPHSDDEVGYIEVQNGGDFVFLTEDRH